MTPKLLVIDPSVSGVSGDMLLSALVDLGAESERIGELVEVLHKEVHGLKRVELKFGKVKRGEFVATYADVKIVEERRPRTGREILDLVKRVSSSLGLSEWGSHFSKRVIERMVEAEASLHGESVDQVELHESGSTDTLLDVLGVAIAVESLGLVNAEIVCMPIALGGGTISFSHGLTPVPAPATLEILRSSKALIRGGPVDAELTTPTGAALLANLCGQFATHYPQMRPLKVGYGAGSLNIAGVPNVLRITLGETDLILAEEEVLLVETDLDDVTGERVGYVLEKLMRIGAKDVTIVPEFRKKNRPGYLVRVITDPHLRRDVVRALIEETGTLGVRYFKVQRDIVPKREVTKLKVVISGKDFEVEVKVSKDLNGRIVRAKPEYESLKRVALQTGEPISLVEDLVLREIHKVLK
jgi:uncharacterized protein (TIGR00299 family) protein